MPDDSSSIKEELIKKIRSEATAEPMTLPDIPTSWERYTILIIFGALTIYMGYIGNNEAMTAFATTIAMYFLSRQGA